MNKNLYRAFLVLLVTVFLVNLTMLAHYLMPLFLGWVFSTVLNPFHKWLIFKKWKTQRAGLVSTLAALFVIILPIGGFGFALVKNLIRIIAPLAKSGVNIDAMIGRIYSFPIAARVFEDQDDLRLFIDENSKKVVGTLMESLTNLLSSAPELILQLVLALLACYFILVDGKRFRTWLDPRIPLPADAKKHLVKSLNDMAYTSFLSMLAAAFAQSLIVFAAFVVLGVPMASLALGVAFVCAWFPIFGVTPVWLGGLIYLAIQDKPGLALGMLVFGIAAGLVDNIVRPWVLKGRADLHPLISLVAIFGAIKYLGILGVLVGPVVVCCLIEFLQLWPQFAELLGLNPDPQK
ncbi:MAG: AI-2E family transporter [Bdellovibrionales bacterium]|nr:AI-2E family transporter [Bdellovibrionales bacterium]